MRKAYIFLVTAWLSVSFSIAQENIAIIPIPEYDTLTIYEDVEIGYGKQSTRSITGAIAVLSAKDFNNGIINDPALLFQGKIPGLGIYKRGSDPNVAPYMRIRGISTLDINGPIIVIDGVINASLDNVDPNDIETISVLKDGSAASIYGIRGSNGAIIITTKTGKRGAGISGSYHVRAGVSHVMKYVPAMNKQEYLQIGGQDLGDETDWQKEVSQAGFQNVHNIAIGGGTENTTFRLSTNFRNIDGVLRHSGFDQVNTRANISHFALDDRLRITANISMSNRESNYSFQEAFRYAVVSNPTSPIRFPSQAEGTPGGYYQAILFDNFNPMAILGLNQNLGKSKTINFNTRLDYSLTENLELSVNYGRQYANQIRGQYYSSQSQFRGYSRNGLAQRSVGDSQLNLFESFGTYKVKKGKATIAAVLGYSYQESQSEYFSIELGDFPSDLLGFNALETSYDRVTGNNLVNVQSDASPRDRVVGFFGRASVSFNDALFFNASLRREGSSKLGAEGNLGLFPSVGMGMDLKRYWNIDNFDLLKFRAAFGTTGSLPSRAGLSKDRVVYSNGSSSFPPGTFYEHLANPNLKWEQKNEVNLGVDFSTKNNRLYGSVDIFSRNINDMIMQALIDPKNNSERHYDNVGQIKTKGVELVLGHVAKSTTNSTWTHELVLSSYKSTLEKHLFEDPRLSGELGAPGGCCAQAIKLAIGEEIGQIWGPRFSGNVSPFGFPIMADISGDGQINTFSNNAFSPDGDFEKLGNGIPNIELGWSHQVNYKRFDLNLFFRGAFGHSLVNVFRNHYEAIDMGAINSYNRVKSRLAIPELTVGQFSSHYVERADYLKLDNATIGYNFDGKRFRPMGGIRLYLTIQNAFTITKYTGADPEPILQDAGASDNGSRPWNSLTPDVLVPGMDRRNNYLTARTYVVGVRVNF